jgi:iron complex transport system ATP-binding protein
LDAALAGSVRIGGKDLSALSRGERARRLAVVLTDPVGEVELTVAEAAALGRHPYGTWLAREHQEDDRRAVDRALAFVGIAELAGRPLRTLSDGERQRTMIARALAQDTAIIVMDEPTAFLDVPARAHLLERLRDWARSEGRTVLASMHDLELAIETADTLWVLGLDGSLVTGAPEELILRGELQRIFPADAQRFDAERGRFRVTPPAAVGSVAIAAPEPERTWLIHAARRSGLALRADAAVSLGGTPGAWHVASAQETRQFSDLTSALALALAWASQSTLR